MDEKTIKNMDFTKLIGEFVSVLITGKGGKKETYMGWIEEVHEFLEIRASVPPKLNPRTNPVIRFYIRTDLVESIWIYGRNPDDTRN